MDILLFGATGDVGRATVQQAIERGQDSAAKLGEALQCGTNCGSCIPEIKQLLPNIVEVVS